MELIHGAQKMSTHGASSITRLNRLSLQLAMLMTLAASPATANPIDSRPSVLGGDGTSTAVVASAPPSLDGRGYVADRESDLMAQTAPQSDRGSPDEQDDQSKKNNADGQDGKGSQGNQDNKRGDRSDDDEILNA